MDRGPFLRGGGLTEKVMQLAGGHRLLEFLTGKDTSNPRVGGEQSIVIEQDVVDADYIAAAEVGVVCLVGSSEEFAVQSEV